MKRQTRCSPPYGHVPVLVSLAEEERHGYAIIQDIESRTGGELRLSPGTLYRSIQRMLEQGLLVESFTASTARSAGGSDGGVAGRGRNVEQPLRLRRLRH